MDEKQLQQKLDAFLADNRQAMIEDIGKLVAVKSVEEAPAPGAPFGPGPRKALDVALSIAQRLGFEVHDGDGYVGWFELAGERKEHIATITHVDVVPEGEGWDGSAYELRVKDGWLLGRGVADDKGPSVLCMYIAKFFKELGVPLKYGFRVLLGCSEETGMKDVPYYLEHNEQPVFCFTPDAEFPVSYGEKGHLNAVFVSAPLGGNLVDFSGGIANNVVPDRAACLVKGDAAALQSTERVSVAEENGMVRLSAKGIGGHAAFPAGSINAIALLVDYLLQNKLCTEEENRFLQLLKTLHDHTDGSGLGIVCRDEIFDPLTIIGGIVKMEDGRLKQSMDMRYPTAITAEELEQKLGAAAQKAGGAVEVGRADKPFYIPKDSPTIQTLLSVYNEVTGSNAQPFTMGGGTYARHFANAAAFGPEEQNRTLPAFAGPMHGANEGMAVDDMLKALKIYILAVWRLQALEF